MIRRSLCSHCGAPIPFEGQDVAVCGYCGVENRWVASPPVSPPAIQGPLGEPGHGAGMRDGSRGNASVPTPDPLGRLRKQFAALSPEERKAAHRRGIASCLGAIAVLAVGATAGGSLLADGCSTSTRSSVAGVEQTTAMPEVTRQWGGIPPAIVDVDGDAVEDVVGYYWDSDSRVFLGAFDGATFATKWSLGPLGKWEGTSHLHVVARGARVVAVRDSMARIVDVKTGKVVTELSLSDKVRSICVPEGSATGAWLSVEDDKHVLVDVATGTAKPESRPADCAHVGDAGHDRVFLKDTNDFRYSVAGSDLKVPGFSGSVFVQDGPNTVVVGSKSPGTPFPILVGGSIVPPPRPNFADPRVRRDLERIAKHADVAPERLTFGGGAFTEAWQTQLGPGGADSLARQESHPIAAHLPGGLVTVYSVGRVAHLVRAEAATGAVLWDVAVPGKESRFDGLSASATRVYLYSSRFLLVFDAKKGAEAGLIGSRAELMR